MEPTPVEDNSG